MADLWTAEVVDLAAIALFLADWPDETADAFFERLYESAKTDYRRKAERVLAALAEAGRLLPGGAEMRERLRFRHPASGDVTYVLHEDMPNHQEYELQRRRMWVGAWQPVPELAPESS